MRERKRNKGLLGLAVLFCLVMLCGLTLQPTQTLATTGIGTVTPDLTSSSTLTTDQTTGSTPTNEPSTSGGDQIQTGGVVTGTVTDSAGVPIPDVAVALYDSNYAFVGSTTTGSNGSYTFYNLNTGNYKIQFQPPNNAYIPQWYQGKADFDNADPVTVTEGSTVSGIDAALVTAGQISGVVTDPGGRPVAGVNVYAKSDGMYASATTGADGTYTITGLTEGVYRIRFDTANYNAQSNANYMGQYYNNQLTWSLADPVTIADGQAVGNINAQLQEGLEISGRVTLPDGSPAVGVYITCSGSDSWQSTNTQGDGSYVFNGLSPGDFTIQFDPGSYNGQNGTNYISSYLYNQVNVSVSQGQNASGIDAQLLEGGQISGKVTLPDGSPAEGVNVVAVMQGGPGPTTVTQADGSYVISQLFPGNYTVQFDPGNYNSLNGTDYIFTYYNNQAQVAVTQGQSIGGIDAVLQQGGGITGRITDSNGVSLTGIYVEVYNRNYSYVAGTPTDVDGTYTVPGLAPGTYKLHFVNYSGLNYVDQWYQDKLDFNSATPVSVNLGQTVSLDVVMTTGGTISGVVTDSTGKPVSNIQINASGQAGGYGYATTGSDGSYRIIGLAPDSYVVNFDPWSSNQNNGTNFLQQYYANQTRYDLANKVTVGAGQEVTGIDAVLQAGGSISGIVTGPNGEPIANVQVTANSVYGGSGWGSAMTGVDGSYTITGLTPDNYLVRFDPSSANQQDGTNYAWQYYANQISQDAAKEVTVGKEQDVSNINIVLQPGASVSGIVTDTNGNPLPGVNVNLWGQEVSPSATTDTDGKYTLRGIVPGNYTLNFDPSYLNQEQGTNYLAKNYPDQSNYLPGQFLTIGEAQVINDINVQLELGGAISGRVTDTKGNPVSGVQVNVTKDNGGQMATSPGYTDANGNYIVNGLAAGTYAVEFSLNGQFVSQYYNGKDAHTYDPVTVVQGKTTANIDVTVQTGGGITGIVTDLNGNPVNGLDVSALDQSGISQAWTQTDSDGNYVLGGLAAGSYTVVFGDTWSNQYNQLNYLITQSSSPLQVSDGKVTSGIDAKLAPGGSISGTVTDAAGNPLANIFVNIQGQNSFFQTQTDGNGHYQMVGLSGGTYKVMFDGYAYGYASVWYKGATKDQAAAIQVIPGLKVANIDAQVTMGGSITGTVTDKDGKPIAGLWVEVYTASSNGDESGNIQGVRTDGDGKYTIGGLASGSYKVLFGSKYEVSNYLKTWFGNQSDFANAAMVFVTAGQSTGNIDAQLQTGGTITGTVTDSNGRAVAGVEIQVYNSAAEYLTGDPMEGENDYVVQYTSTDANGHYSVTGLAQGNYKLSFVTYLFSQVGLNYAYQWSGGGTSFDSATAVAVVPGQIVKNIDAQLQTGGSISGTIVDSNGTPVASAMVLVYDDKGNYTGYSTNSDAYGHYTVSGLAAGNYKVQFMFFSYKQAYDQWYGNKATMDAAALVTVAMSQEVANIDAKMMSGGFISGKVTDEAGNPISGRLKVYDQNGHYVGTAWANNFGAYTMPVPAGTYQVKVDWGQYTDYTTASTGPLTVAAGQTISNADLKLTLGTKLSGKVFGDYNTTLSGIEIDVYDSNNNLVASTETVAGEYYLNLQPGTYKLQIKASNYNASHGTTYIDQWYKNQTDIANATSIVVVNGQTQNGLNIRLTSAALPVKWTVDKPSANASLTGVVNVSGWFLDQAGVAKLEVLVDNQVVGEASYGDARPDVAAAYLAYNNPNSGFHYNQDVTSLADGIHYLTLRETSATGEVTLLPEITITTRNLPVKAVLDTPAKDAQLSGKTEVSGWLLDGVGISNIEVLIDGQVVGVATYGDERPDVYAAFPAYNNLNSGFHYRLDTGSLSVGAHTLNIRETAQDGSQQIIATQSINVTAAKGNLDDLNEGATVSGTLGLHGWYLDQAGVAEIQVLIDGNVVGEATYGDARPDVYAAYPEYNNPNSGFHYALDTLGLSPGSHTLTVREVSQDGSVRDLPSRTISVNIQDRGFLDGLDDGANLSGSVNLSGWYLSKVGVAKIEIMVDGNVVGEAAYGDPRPDVYAAFPDYNNQNSGYHYTLNTASLSAGSHTLTLWETGSDGSTHDFVQRTFTLDTARKGTIDNLDDGAALSGVYNLYGWYLDSKGVAKIQIVVDGRVVGEASYGDARPDVYAAYPEYNNQNVGYHYALNTSALGAGSHSIVIREISQDGSQNDLPARTFNVGLQPKGTIDGITDGMTMSGTYNVSGWFLDTNTVQKVEVLVDGQVVGTATYGDARPDVAAVFPAYNNPNSGFHYSLDTTSLSAGSHTLTVRETSTTGVTTTLPEYSIVVSQ